MAKLFNQTKRTLLSYQYPPTPEEIKKQIENDKWIKEMRNEYNNNKY